MGGKSDSSVTTRTTAARVAACALDKLPRAQRAARVAACALDKSLRPAAEGQHPQEMSDFSTLTSLGLHEILARRWSPRAWSRRPVEPEKLRALFEAARWSASCFNEQPWRFVVATQAEPEDFARLLGLLVEQNQAWAKNAWVLGISA